ncbi:FAD binding domain-containing protein [Gilbertella persicaria]|uniref:FAD binding domain-containing protein n=1 Tax=Gilbertella persicaria TaxID=101096 RepID=UPI00221E86AC|nr:FAD binding domain-containing protein [Gilbertella persicaria]KAI8084101.1 FAD binding domain-containing protein [Gilbertella persicaria]
MSNNKVDIFVSGAGPTGLFFTYLMAQRGHTVYCVDPKSGPTDQSRALLTTSRTLEILESQGLASGFLSEAYAFSGTRMFRHGAPIAQMEACGESPFSQVTLMIQSKTEEFLANRIKEDTECDVHWNTELVSYVQEEDKVVATVRDIYTKQEHMIEAKYIVGADGSHSRVRKGDPDWTYEGTTIQTKFALADLVLKGDQIHEVNNKFNLFTNDYSMFGMGRINHPSDTDENPIFRVFGNLEAYERQEGISEVTHGLRDKKEQETPSLEFVQSWMDKMTAPMKFEASKLVWSSYFKINERMANGLRRRRAFLVGDAAHCHSPAGGQGMNMGIQDAFNLAWKMSDVLKGVAADPEKLLNSYNDEREPIIKATIKKTGDATQTGTSGGYLSQVLRASFMTVVLMVPQVRHYAFKNLMQLNLTIDPKTSDIMDTSDKGLTSVGEFVPDCGRLRKSIIPRHQKPGLIQRYTLRDLVTFVQTYSVIFIGTCLPNQTPNMDLMEKFWKKTRKYPVKRLVIQSVWHVLRAGQFPSFVDMEEEQEEAKNSFFSEERMDSSISVTNVIGLYPLISSYFATPNPPSVLLVVRPDMYIAQSKFLNNESDLDNALKFLSTTFTRSQ